MSSRRLRAWFEGVGARKYLTLAGTVAVVALGAVVVTRTIDGQEVLGAFRSADPLLLALAVGVYALSWPVRGKRYDEVLRALDRRCGLGFLTAAVFVSQTANLVVPARAGDGVRLYLLKERRRVSYPVGTASMAVERVFDLVAITVLGALAFAALLVGGWTVDVGETSVTTAALAVGTSALVISAVVLVLARSERALGPPIRAYFGDGVLARAVDALLGVGASVRTVARDTRALVTVGTGSLVVWTLDVVTAVLVLAALGGVGNGLLLLAVGTLAVSVGNLAKVLPLSQGGIGLYEAAFTALVVGVAPVGAGTALVAAILDHALKNAITLVGGALAVFGLNVSLTAPQPDTETGQPEPPSF